MQLAFDALFLAVSFWLGGSLTLFVLSRSVSEPKGFWRQLGIALGWPVSIFFISGAAKDR